MLSRAARRGTLMTQTSPPPSHRTRYGSTSRAACLRRACCSACALPAARSTLSQRRPFSAARCVWLFCVYVCVALCRRAQRAAAAAARDRPTPNPTLQAPAKGGFLRGEVSLGFTCDPRDRAALVDAALGVVAALQADGPTAEEVETVRCGRAGWRGVTCGGGSGQRRCSAQPAMTQPLLDPPPPRSPPGRWSGWSGSRRARRTGGGTSTRRRGCRGASLRREATWTPCLGAWRLHASR